MSHNKIKVGGQNPNASGEISVSLNNLSNVSTASASNGVLLKYFNSWTFGLPGFEASDLGLVASNRTTGGVSTVYSTGSNSRNSVTTDSRDSGYGQFEGSGVTAIGDRYQSGRSATATTRYNGFSLPANGKYLILFSHTPKFNSAAGQSIVQWMDENDNTLGPQIQVKRDDRGSKKLFGYIETGGSAVGVYPTIINTNNHRVMSYEDGDSWRVFKIG